MTQRLSQAKLQRCQVALASLIASVHDARQRFPQCAILRPKHLAGLSLFLRELLSLSHLTDYSVFEVQLKRRLLRVGHRLNGNSKTPASPEFALREQLPSCYQDSIARYDAAAKELFRALAMVDIHRNHQQLMSVSALLEASAQKQGS